MVVPDRSGTSSDLGTHGQGLDEVPDRVTAPKRGSKMERYKQLENQKDVPLFSAY